jgi:hypothetical protein
LRAVHHILIYESFILGLLFLFFLVTVLDHILHQYIPLRFTYILSCFLQGVQSEPAIWYYSSRNWISKYFVMDIFNRDNTSMSEIWATESPALLKSCCYSVSISYNLHIVPKAFHWLFWRKLKRPCFPEFITIFSLFSSCLSRNPLLICYHKIWVAFFL